MCSSIKLTSIENNFYWFKNFDSNDERNLWYLGSKVVSIKENSIINFSTNKEVKSKFNLLGISFGKPYIQLLDGINSEGLIGEVQVFQNGTSSVKEEYGFSGINGLEIVTWFLSQCKNTTDVLELATKTQILNMNEKEQSKYHYTFVDKDGYSIVLEPVNNGKIKIIDNTIGILVNDVSYEKQINELSTYLGNNNDLTNEELELPTIVDISLDGVKVSSSFTKQQKSILGSYSSTDRFIKLAILKYLNEDGKVFCDDEIIAKGLSLINSVAVPRNKGYLYYSNRIDGKKIKPNDSYTQYTVVYNLKKKEMYLKPDDLLIYSKYDMKNIEDGIKIHEIIHNSNTFSLKEL